MDQLLFLLNKRHRDVETGILSSDGNISPMAPPYSSPSVNSRRQHFVTVDDTDLERGHNNNNNNNNHHDISFVTANSNRSRSTVRSKPQLANTGRRRRAGSPPSYKYVSPFIVQANAKAKERSKKAIEAIREQKATYRDSHLMKKHNDVDWTMNIGTAGLFDPNLRKKEIFKIEPRAPQMKENANPQLQRIVRDAQHKVGQEMKTAMNAINARRSRSGNSGGLTIRTESDIPTARPRASVTSPTASPRSMNGSIRDSTSSFGSPRSSQQSLKSDRHRNHNNHNHFNHNNHSPSSAVDKSNNAANTDATDMSFVEVVSRSTSPMDPQVIERLLLDDDEVSEIDVFVDREGSRSNSSIIETDPRFQYPGPVSSSSSSARRNDIQSDTGLQTGANMLSSMARLMDAVGSIVTKVSTTQREQHMQMDKHLRASRYLHQNMRHVQQHHHNQGSTTAVSPSTEYSPAIAVERRLAQEVSRVRLQNYTHYNADNNQTQKQPLQPEPYPHSNTGNRKNVESGANFSDRGPLTEAAVLDLLLAKLQAIEASEKETQQLLVDARLQQAVRTASDTSISLLQDKSNSKPAMNDNSNSDCDMHSHSTAVGLPSKFNSIQCTSDGLLVIKPTLTMTPIVSPSAENNQFDSLPLDLTAAPELSVLLDRNLAADSRAEAANVLRAEQLREATFDLPLMRLPELQAASATLRAVAQARAHIDRCNALRHAAFRNKGVPLFEAVQVVSDALVEEAVQQVANEVDATLGEMAAHVIEGL